jgi:hypothetical protein
MGRHFVAGPAATTNNKKPPVTENGKIQPPEKHPKRKKEKKSKDSKKRKLDTETKVKIYIKTVSFFFFIGIGSYVRLSFAVSDFLYCIRNFLSFTEFICRLSLSK